MRSSIKPLLSVLLFLIGSLISHRVSATHTMGADITYTCQAPGQYEVTLTLFRDCAGILPLDPQSLEYSSASCGTTSSINLTGTPAGAIDVTPLCPTATSACAGGSSAFGIEQYTYTGTLNLPTGACDDWVLSWDNCCRNFAITTLNGPGNQSTYIQANLDNTLTDCNNSPVFNNIPTPLICINQAVVYNHGVTDPDGDQLVFSLASCQQSVSNGVLYATGFNATTPLSSSTGITIDSQTGEIRFTPNQFQIGVICVKVEEFRNGVKIGEVVRDMQFSVIDCNNTPPVASGVNGDTVNYSLNACLGGQVCFGIDISDPDGDNVTASWNNGIPGGTFTITGAGTASPSANFCWTPTIADTGSHFFTVTVEDDHCPLTGAATYAFSIEVLANIYSLDAGLDDLACRGDSIQLNATSTTMPVSYQWSPAIGLSDDTIANPRAAPNSTTIYSVTTTYADGCTAQDFVQVTVDQGPDVTISPQVAYACPGNSVTFSANSSTAISYLWNTGSTGTSVGITSSNDSTVSVLVENTNGCKDSTTAQLFINQPTANLCDVIYVSPGVAFGSGDGTQVSPANLIDAIGSASCSNTLIKMGIGTYTITSAITNIGGNLTLEGGFDPTLGWEKRSIVGATRIFRTTDNPDGLGFEKRLTAIEITAATNFRFQDLTIEVDNAVDSSMSTYGLYLNQCSNYDIVRCQIIAGNAAAGLDGTPGDNGDNGVQGSFGTDGSPNTAGDPGHGGQGGSGGGGATGGGGGVDLNGTTGVGASNNGNAGTNSANARAGGAGGGGGQGGERDNNGGRGGNGGGTNGTTTGGGVGGTGGTWSTGNAGNGVVGSDGIAGTNGTAGANGAAGTHVGGYWVPGSQGISGTDGLGGGGGAGGGGGGGEDAPFGGAFDGAGDGGGGGGGGGEGGAGGTGGTGGGSSYGVYLYNNGINGNFLDCSINPGTAGAGGAGGTGGTGGTGGNGGNGGDAGATTNIGQGGDGGDGGNGGAGGAGGAGQAGESVAIHQNGGTAPVNSSTTYNFAAEPQIRMDNVSCTGVGMTLTGPSSGFWSFSNPVVLIGANPGNPVTVQVNTLGRMDVSFGGTTYRGFANIISDNSTEPIASTSAPQVSGEYRICAGESIDLFATNPGAGTIINWDLDGGASPSTYSGLTFQTLNNIPFNTPGTYYIELRYEEDCCGLTDPDTVRLIVDEQPNAVVAGTTDFCAGSGGTILTASGGSTYQWSPFTGLSSTSTSSVVANPTTNTTYVVTTTNAAGTCFDTETVNVTVNDLLLNTSHTDAGCLPDGTATVTASGGTGIYNYVWNTSPVQTGAMATSLDAGSYMVVVEDQAGCEDSINVIINQTPGTIDSYISSTTPTSCFGDTDGTATVTITGGTGPYVYSWSVGGAGTAATTNPLPAGSYTVTVTDQGTGCETQSTAVIVEPSPLSLNVLSVTDPDCETYAEAQVNASGGQGPFSYSWNTTPAQTGPQATQLEAGIYDVTVVDQDNCSTMVQVTVPGPDSPVNIDSIQVTDPSNCGNMDGSATAFATGSGGNLTYTWLTTPSNTVGQTLSNQFAGAYEVIVTGNNGCADTLGATIGPGCVLSVEELDLEAYWNEDKVSISWKTLENPDNAGFEWQRSVDQVNYETKGWQHAMPDPNGEGFYTAEDEEVIPGETYFYRVVQFDQEGNSSLSNVEEVIIPFAKDFELERVYFEPNTQQIKLEVLMHEAGGLNIAIYNTAGQLVAKNFFELNEGISILNMYSDKISSGIYLLDLNNESSFRLTDKIFIQN
ncbi:MAG: T9SS type A sorting domain-containing protein [Bacteroidota bacterium]